MIQKYFQRTQTPHHIGEHIRRKRLVGIAQGFLRVIVYLDHQSIRTGRRQGSLLGTIDRTVTSLGARLLADWLAAPLTDVPAIDARLDAVAELVADASLTAGLRDALRHIHDVQRLLARATTGRASPRDLRHLGRTLACLPKVKAKLTGRTSALLQQLESRLDLCADVRGPLDEALVDDCPLVTRDGGFIRPGYRAELDELRELSAGGKKWMAQYQAAESRRTGGPAGATRISLL